MTGQLGVQEDCTRGSRLYDFNFNLIMSCHIHLPPLKYFAVASTYLNCMFSFVFATEGPFGAETSCSQNMWACIPAFISIHFVYIVSFLLVQYIGFTVLLLCTLQLFNSSTTEFQQLKLALVCECEGETIMIRGGGAYLVGGQIWHDIPHVLCSRITPPSPLY